MSDSDARSELDVAKLNECEQRGLRLWNDLQARPWGPDNTLPVLVVARYSVEIDRQGLNPLDPDVVEPGRLDDIPAVLALGC